MSSKQDALGHVTIPLWRYESLMVDQRVLNYIALMLDGVEWDASTIEQVADIVRGTGRKIEGPNE